MRTPLELWLIVEENFDKYYIAGLCGIFDRLRRYGEINGKEHIYLHDFVQEYKQNRRRGWYSFIWEKGKAKPRKQFIQKQILKELRK